MANGLVQLCIFPPASADAVDRVAVIDFETTGLCAGRDRIIEVGAAIVSDGVVVDTFSQLMDPGFAIPRFITGLTGISDAMVRGKPSPEAVMPRLRAFLGGTTCVAHNAAFDQRFYGTEMAAAGEPADRQFVCSMMLSRRLVRDAPDHRLGTLVRHLRLTPPPGLRAHRALDDVLMTCELWKHLCAVVRGRLGGDAPEMRVLQGIARKPKAQVDSWLASIARSRAPAAG